MTYLFICSSWIPIPQLLSVDPVRNIRQRNLNLGIRSDQGKQNGPKKKGWMGSLEVLMKLGKSFISDDKKPRPVWGIRIYSHSVTNMSEIEPGTPASQASTLGKSYSNSLYLSEPLPRSNN
jgi:hypothetical protein